MNNLCDKYIFEFSRRLIIAFSIDVPVDKLMEMWSGVVSDGRVSVVFAGSDSDTEPAKVYTKITNVCTKLLASGANKGAECGKKCPSESPFCLKHGGKQPSVRHGYENPDENKPDENKPDVQTCSYLMASGAKKGMACGKKCADGSDMCSAHLKVKPRVNKPIEQPVKSGDPTTTYKVTFKQRENGLLVAINATPSGTIFVFNNTKDRLISGKLTPEDHIIPLDEEDCGFCRDNNLKMVPVISSKLAIEDILDEIQQ